MAVQAEATLIDQRRAGLNLAYGRALCATPCVLLFTVWGAELGGVLAACRHRVKTEYAHLVRRLVVQWHAAPHSLIVPAAQALGLVFCCARHAVRIYVRAFRIFRLRVLHYRSI